MLQCNEPRADDAPPADIALSNPPSLGKKGFEAGWFEMLLFSWLVLIYIYIATPC